MTLSIPEDVDDFQAKAGAKTISLTNLRKVFWPELQKTKRDLLLYYASIAPVLLPHLQERAMVMKRYPNGIHGKFFFMKRTPDYKPAWLQTCSIEHGSGSIIDFPIVEDLASLLWIVNLGCIDLNPWYARCDDTNRPDFLHFDLDPVEPAGFAQVCQAALLVRAYLSDHRVSSFAKTTGSRGIHIYIAIERGPVQKDVWRVAKSIAFELAKQFPDVITAEYRIAKRPANRVLVDYNQNAWGRTLASVYSVRPKPEGAISTPLRWEEVEAKIDAAAFTMDTVPGRVAELGDLFKPLLQKRGRCKLEMLQ